jgi:putative ABC transport system ATP-binding protein
MIRAENISKRYSEKGRQVLSGVNLVFESGEFCAVMGESGSGKSTLLAIIAGILKPDSGRILVSKEAYKRIRSNAGGIGSEEADNNVVNLTESVKSDENQNHKLDEIDIYSLSDEELSGFHREKLGYVPQGNVFLKNYTVLENLVTPFLTKDNLGTLNDRAYALLESLGVKEPADRHTFELSGGEQKRVALARAFMTDPEIVIADEPTTGLDASTGDIILGFLKSKAEEGKTVIVATHDEHVKAYATRTITTAYH